MEKDLFSYSGWDGDQECMIFYDPVLKVPIGEFEPGQSFGSAAIIQSHPVDRESYLEFYNDGEFPVAKFLIGIKILGQVAID
jgi:hypothetical protein